MQHGAGRLAAGRRGVGRRRLPVRPRPGRHLLGAAHPGPAARLPGREDRSGALQGVRGVEHAHPPAGQRGPGRRGRGAARPSLRHRRRGRARGRGAGRELGFPTANLSTDNDLVPPTGVYATTIDIDGTRWPSITNVGVRPTFEAAGPVTVETHVLGLQADVYGGAGVAELRAAAARRAALRRRRRAEGADRGRRPARPPAVRQHLGMTMTSNVVRVHDADLRRPGRCSARCATWPSHVATYAGGKSVAATVADEVVTAAEAAIAASRDDGTPDRLPLRAHRPSASTSSSPARTRRRWPPRHLSRGPGLSVDWQPSTASQPVCHIRQAID